MHVEPVVLAGRGVRLEPLCTAHIDDLAQAVEDGALYTLPVTIVPHPRDLGAFVADAERALQLGRELAFGTRDLLSGRIVGSTRFRCIEAAHKRLEIGFTFIAASRQRTHVNTEAKYLMLRHAFDSWAMNRVELLTDVRNAASRAAIARIGARQEGVLRSHMVMRDGFVRDSVLFSIVRADWPEVQRALEARGCG